MEGFPAEEANEGEVLAGIEYALLHYNGLIDAAQWTPEADVEMLEAVLGRKMFSPFPSLPRYPPVFANGCLDYPAPRPAAAYSDRSLVDLPAKEKIAYYRAEAEKLAARRGMDLCWEVDRLFAANAYLRLRAHGRENLPLCERMNFCKLYKACLYGAPGG